MCNHFCQVNECRVSVSAVEVIRHSKMRSIRKISIVFFITRLVDCYSSIHGAHNISLLADEILSTPDEALSLIQTRLISYWTRLLRTEQIVESGAPGFVFERVNV